MIRTRRNAIRTSDTGTLGATEAASLLSSIAQRVIAGVLGAALVFGAFGAMGALAPEAAYASEALAATESGKAATSPEAALQDAIDAFDLLDAYKASDDIGEGQAILKKMYDRLGGDAEALKASDWAEKDRALTAIQNERDILAFLYNLTTVVESMLSVGENASIDTLATAIASAYDSLSEMNPPACARAFLEKYTESLYIPYEAIAYISQDPDSVLAAYQAQELIQWWVTSVDSDALDALLEEQSISSKAMLINLQNGEVDLSMSKPQIDAVDRIAPNLYPRLDSAANIKIASFTQRRRVTVEAEIVGFTQAFKQQFTLDQGLNNLSIKPAPLPANKMPDLQANTTTQFNITVIDEEAGKVVAQESRQVELLSIYDFEWSNDEFGSTAAFDILAWLRPQADEVNATNRYAAEVLKKWTNGEMQSLAGYQYGENGIYTLLQVAAIQTAIADQGVEYVMDGYSFGAHQHILTPDKVLQKKQGLCIETSLLMASCLMSAGMHPVLILTPGHAQVAVETYQGSGKYYLIETTQLSNACIDTRYEETDPQFWSGILATDANGTAWTIEGSSDEWRDYFAKMADDSDEYGGIFVIDCNLQPVLNIQGLENL